ncbi:MAG: hypothetical protein M3357_12805 [Actinomycetota bacterium]|nr:hypothetical protein [Actinomycetota bacterium]
MTQSPETPDRLAEAVDALHDRYDQIEVSGRTIRLETPVNGDAGFAALRMLGIAQAASPVGVAAHGPGGVAIGVWNPPDLYLARWTQNRWVVGYRIPKGSKPSDYIGAEGRIPSRLEMGHWYASVPDEVRTAFLEVGLFLDDPPFPPPEPPSPPKAKERPARKAPSRPAPPKPAVAERPAPRRDPPAPKPPPAPTSRVCSGCNMRRALTQFISGSDLCVDCR